MDSLPPAAPSPRPFSLGSAALWALFALLLTFLFVGFTQAGREGATPDLVSLTACRMLAFSITLFGILRLHEPETSVRHVLGLRAPPVLVIVLAVAVGAALALPSDWIDQIVEARYPRPPEEREALERVLALPSVSRRVAFVLTLGLLQPAFDELFFRGALFTPLRRTRNALSVMFASVALEAFVGMSPRAMAYLVAASLVFAWMRAVTGSAVPAILARVAFSAVGVVPLALGLEELKPTKTLLLASAVVGLGGLLALSAVSRRNERMAAARALDGV